MTALSLTSSPDRWRILVVDDEPSVRLLLKKLFSREHDVATASTGDEAMEMLRTGEYDLLLTDKNLPGPGGVEIARFARTRLPNACIVLITGYASHESAEQLIGVVDDYVTKPFHIQPMRERLQDLMARRRMMAERGTAPLMAVPQPSQRVLVLEPEGEERNRLVETLTRLGHDVITGDSVSEFLGQPELRGVVVSTTLCSHELYREIWRRQARSNEFGVVVTSEGESLDGSMAALSLGADGRLVYPLGVDVVEQVLTRVLGRGPHAQGD
jgi:CheY-like chemotaxis protein